MKDPYFNCDLNTYEFYGKCESLENRPELTGLLLRFARMQALQHVGKIEQHCINSEFYTVQGFLQFGKEGRRRDTFHVANRIANSAFTYCEENTAKAIRWCATTPGVHSPVLIVEKVVRATALLGYTSERFQASLQEASLRLAELVDDFDRGLTHL